MRTTDHRLQATENTTRSHGTLLELVRAVVFVMAFALATASATHAAARHAAAVPAPGTGVTADAVEQVGAASDDLVGTWEGVLEVPNGSLRFIVHLASDGEGGYTATLDSPDQDARGIPVAETVVDGDVLRLSIPAAGARYEGRIDLDAEVIRGTFTQGMASLPLELRRVAEDSGPRRPQTSSPAERGSTTPAPISSDDALAGIWQGPLDVGGFTLRLVVHLEADGDGGYIATMDSPDQDARGIPVAETVVEGDVLRLSIPAAGAEYEGRIDADVETIRGHFRQGGASFPLELRRVDELPEVHRPQTPRPPFPYDEEEVVYPNAEAGITLAGTLAIPHSPGPHPAVLLITGSGPQDRDETVFGHKPFLVISDYLARRGIAVLRVDDRGVGRSTGDFASATALDFASDVAAGVAYLLTRPEIDPARIGLIGHSEGGQIAPLVAVESDDVAFLVLLAGPGIPGEEMLYLQSELIMRANGAPESAIAANRVVQETMFKIVLEEEDAATRRERVHESLTRLLVESGDQLGIPPSSREAFIQGQLQATTSEWFRFFLVHDPVPVLERVRVPVLALNGSKDLHVPARENLSAIEAALRAGGNPSFEVRELPGLNHLFQTAETGSPSEYERIEETFSPVALEAMAEWILKVAGGS